MNCIILLSIEAVKTVALNLFVLEAHLRMKNSSAAHFHITIFKTQTYLFNGKVVLAFYSKLIQIEALMTSDILSFHRQWQEGAVFFYF